LTENKRTREQDAETLRIHNKAKAALIDFYGDQTEDHIITTDEATSIFGLTDKNQLTGYLRRAFSGTGSLNGVLKALGLPYKIRKF